MVNMVKKQKLSKKSSQPSSLLWEVTKPGLVVLVFGIIYSILQSPGVLSQLKLTIDEQSSRIVNESTWWMVSMLLVGIGITIALVFWAWKIIQAVSRKPVKAKTSKQKHWETLASWSASIPLLALVFMASLLNIVAFWSLRYFDIGQVTLQQLPDWYTVVIGTLSSTMTLIFISLPFFLVFTLYFLSKSNLLKR